MRKFISELILIGVKLLWMGAGIYLGKCAEVKYSGSTLL